VNRRQIIVKWLSGATLGALAGAGVALAQATPQGAQQATARPDVAQIDKPVKDFKLRDITSEKGSMVSLSQYKGKKAVVAVFLSYNCSTTWRYEKRLGKLMADYGKKDVVFLGIHSNVNETDDGVKKYAEARNFDAPVLDDKNNSFAEYAGARVTPTVLVIDKQGVLRYRGSFDETPDEASAKQPFVANALAALTSNKPVTVKTSRAFG
jgi:peroxiredoxin